MNHPFEEARKYIPGGVNSPARAFGAVGGTPFFAARGKGTTLVDHDGKEYVDFLGSWGPLILGHAAERIVDAVCRAATTGTSFGIPTERETHMARMVCERVRSIDRVRFVNSGTEATMGAARLARGFTGRDLIIKFDGCYHGHADGFLVSAGSGTMTLAIPGSPGVPAPIAALTLVARFNDADHVEGLLDRHAGRVAAVIVEPVAGNMGVVPPAEGFLRALRDLCDRHGALLIFDEVMTGFRVAPGGAQELYDVTPDLTTLGKVVGGGLPVGAFGGRGDIMKKLAPEGPVYQAGTLSGNPLAMAAGIATLEGLTPDVYRRLETLGERLEARLQKVLATENLTLNRAGSMFTIFFHIGPITDADSARAADTTAHSAFFHAMLERGFYLPPSQFESAFLCAEHTEDQIDAFAAAALEAAAAARGRG